MRCVWETCEQTLLSIWDLITVERLISSCSGNVKKRGKFVGTGKELWGFNVDEAILAVYLRW